MSIEELYKTDSNWIKASDLKGMAVKVTIDTVKLEEVGDSGFKVVLHFAGREKTLVLNKTNAKCLASSFGDDEQSWKGEEIIMYPTTTEYNNKTVPCVRVRVEVPMAEQEDEIPF